MSMRLDVALVERGLARSRTHAASLVEAERVIVSGMPARKASQPVTEESEIKVLEAIDYVSRAGHKLAGALDEFAEIDIEGKQCLDVGAWALFVAGDAIAAGREKCQSHHLALGVCVQRVDFDFCGQLVGCRNRRTTPTR